LTIEANITLFNNWIDKEYGGSGLRGKFYFIINSNVFYGTVIRFCFFGFGFWIAFLRRKKKDR
jgi:hypothetical protein